MCPCCGLIVKDDEGRDVMENPICPSCKKEVDRTQARIELLRRTYHPDCLWETLNKSDQQKPQDNPA